MLVSNVGQTSQTGAWGTKRSAWSQGFTTGSQTGGYALESFSLVATSNVFTFRIPEIRAELWDATPSGAPKSKVASLTVPSAISAGTVSFAAPPNTTLLASTTYFLVMYTTTSYNFGVKSTTSDEEDSGGATGWSIADGASLYSAKTPTEMGTWGTLRTNGPQIRVNGSAVQATGPDAPTFDPDDGETTTNAGTNITLTFAEAIKADDEATPADFTATTLKTILTLTEDDENGTAIPYSASINSAKTVITIDPTSNLADGAVYVAVSDEWYDAEGNQGAAANATFTVDATGPTVTFSPAAGDTVTDASGNITLTFTEPIKSDSSGADFTATTLKTILTLAEDDENGTAIPYSATIDATKKIVTINPSSDLPAGDVYVAVSSSHWDAHGNQGTATSATFTVGTTAPDAPTFEPDDGDTTTNAGTNITLTFAEAIKSDASATDFTATALKNILTLAEDDENGTAIPFSASIDTAKKVVTVDPTSNLSDGAVYVAISDAWYDAEGNQGAAADATFTVDATAPSVTFSPAAGDTVTDASGNVTLTFTEPIKSDSSGADFTATTLKTILTLAEDDENGTAIPYSATIDATKMIVTINPASDLPEGDVYVAVSADHWDAHGNQGSATSATFTVGAAAAPDPPSFLPANGATVTNAGANITLTFAEKISKDSSGADLANADLSGILTLKTDNASGTAIPHTATINTAKTKITIDPTSNLADGAVYVAISASWYSFATGIQGAAASATFTVDATAPSPTFLPANGATVTNAGGNITLSFGEAIRKDGSGADFANSDLSGILTLTQTNAGGTAIPYAATINTAKTKITIDPNANLPEGPVYVAISGDYWDAGGNRGAATSATFTVDAALDKPVVTRTGGANSIAVSWGAVANADGYRVQYGVANSGQTDTVDVGSATSRTVTGLEGGTSYAVRVEARDSTGTRSNTWSDWANVSTHDKLATPSVTRAGGGNRITVTWDDIEGANQHVVQYGVESSGQTNSVTVGDVTSHTVTGLDGATRYTSRVLARDTNGAASDSDWSGWAAVATADLLDTPSPTYAPGNGQLTVSWDAVAGANKYLLAHGEAGSGMSTTVTLGNVTTHTITGLTNGTAWAVRMQAQDTTGTASTSLWSTWGGGTPRTVPGAVTGLDVTAGAGKLDLEWTAPASNGGSAITGYDVHYTSAPKSGTGAVLDGADVQTGASPSPADGWVDAKHTGTTAEHEITGLTGGDEHRVRVRAANAAGGGAWEHETDTPEAVTGPDAPTFLPADGATVILPRTNITLTFGEAIKRTADGADFSGSTQLKTILTLKIDNAGGTNIAYAATINSEKTVITINPSGTLSDGAVYVAVSDAWYDAEGNQGAAADATFTVDSTGPVVTFSPAAGDTVTNAAGNITLTFDEAIKADGTGTDFDNSDIDDILTLKKGSSTGEAIGFDATIDGAKKIVTINPDSNLDDGDVYVAVSSSYWDAHGNRGAADTATFTVDTSGPDAPTFDPDNGETTTSAGTNITLTFGEAIKKDDEETPADFSNATIDAILTLKTVNASGTAIPFDATINSAKTKITIDPSSNLSDGAVYVAVSDEWYDGDGVQGSAAEATFTVDTAGPTVTFDPANGDTTDNAETNVTLTFNEAIRADGSGTNFSNTTIDNILTLKKGSSGGDDIGFDATIDGAMKVVTINPSSNLEEGDVYVAVSSSYWDAHGNRGSATSATFEVDALSSDASLSTLTGTTSTDGSTFSGMLAIASFSGTKTDYEVTVGNAVTHAKLTPTTTHSGAGVKVGKGTSLTAVTSGEASEAIALAVGANALKVEVTAEDSMTETYTVTVKRRFAMPTNLAASGDGKLALTWTAPTGGTLTGYDVHYTASTTVANDAAKGTNVATEWVDAAHTGTLAEDEITGLTNGTPYRLRVRAKNADVEGEWVFGTATPKSSDKTLSTLAGSTSTDGSDFSGTLDIGTFTATTTSYTAEVAGSVTHVKLTPAVNDSDAKVKVGPQGGTLTAVTSGQPSAAIALDPGANAIDVEVTAEDETVQTYTVTVTRLSVPSGVTVAPGAAGGEPSIAVTFGATPSGWSAVIQIKPASDTDWPERGVGSKVPSGVSFDSGLSTGDFFGGTFVFKGFQENAAYDVRLHLAHATSGEIIPASSTPVQVTTWTVPGAPTAVTATAASSSALNVGWTAPTETGGTAATISGYKVRWREKDTAPHTAGDQAGAWNADDGVAADSATAHAISGLESNTAYEVELRALNGIDPGGAWSDAGTGMTALPLGVFWSASLRVQATGSSRVGCDNGVTGKQCSTGTVLTEDDFTVNGRSYSVTRIRYITSGVLTVRLTRGPDAALGALSLCIGADAAFPLTGQNSELTFTGTGLGWSAGDTVPLRIATSCAAGAPTVPDQPADLAATPDDGRLDLTWRAPPGSVSGYDVHYTSSTTVDNDADVGSNTNAATGWVAVSRTESDPPAVSQSITGLTNGTPYRVRVRAKNAIGVGDWARRTATPAVPVAPSVPRNVTVTPGDGKLTMSWEAPASWGTWPAEAYFVQWKLSSAGATDWSFVYKDNEAVGFGADDTSFVFTGPQADGGGDPYTVTNGTAYDLRIQAISQKPGGSNPDTDLLRSGWVTVSDKTPAADAPSVPRSVTVTPGDGKLTMSWEAPASWGTWPAEAYFVQWKLSSAGATDWGFVMRDNEVVGIGADDTGFVFTGPQADGGGDPYTVTNGTAYDLRIQAISQKPGGSNPDTDLLRSGWVAVTDSTPTADAVPPPAPPAPPGAIWSAVLTVDRWGANFGCSNYDSSADNCSAALTEDRFTHPDGGPTYAITLIAAPSSHDFLHVEFDRAVPDVRMYLNVGGRQFDSDDAGVTDNNGLTGNVWQWAPAGLTWTDGQKVTLSLSPSALPDAPTGLAVTPGDGTLDLAWTAPPGPVTGYDVHYTSSTGAGGDDAASGSDPAAGWVDADHSGTLAEDALTGLANDTPYRLRVRAVNAHGDGAWARGTGTPAAVPLDPPSPAPGAIWSARLTVKVTHDGFGPGEHPLGCRDDAKLDDNIAPKPAAFCEPTGALSDNDFSFAGAPYEITQLSDHFFTSPGSRIFMRFDTPVRNSLRNALQLRIKGSGAGSADLALPLVDAELSAGEDRGGGLEHYALQWRGLAIPNWQAGARFSLSLERVQPWVSLQKVDRMLRVLWTMPGEGTVSGWDVHYTASSSVAGDAPAGADPATGWVDTDSTGTEGIHEIGGLENGAEYRVRVRARWAGLGAGGADILSPWGFRAGAPKKVAPSQLTPDANRLTGITFNDGVQDLPVESNIANAVGFGGPGWYVVHVPPGVRSVTVTPTWTNTSITGVNGDVTDITVTREPRATVLEWDDDESGDGKTLALRDGYGSVRLEMLLLPLEGTYRFLLSHNNAWKSADDRLEDLALRVGSGSGSGVNPGHNSQRMRPAVAVRFDQEFDDETESYRAEVPRDTTEVTLDARPSDPKAGVTVNGEYPAGPVTLGEGETEIEVEVTAEDPRYRRTYVVTVAREGAQQREAESAAALTASFEGVPDAHDGKAAFPVDLRFSEALGEDGAPPVPASFAVKGGKVKGVERVEPGLWRVRIKPASWRDLTVTLAGGRDCAEKGAVCAAGGKRLSETAAAEVAGPVRIRLEGGTAREGKDESLDFRVTLNRAAGTQVSVDYATADGTAKAGEDYTAVSGTLRFAPGETERTVAVPILDDAIDEGKEKFRLRLSNPQGAYLRNMHREAVGVIKNDDPLQKMWLSRFGRTVGSQVTDAVSERLQGGLAPGAHVTLAGQGVDLSKADDGKVLADTLTGLARAFGAPSGPAANDDDEPFAHHGLADPWNDSAAAAAARSMTGRELLLGSSFHVASQDGRAGPALAAWGRVAQGSFDGEEDAGGGKTRIDGTVLTGTLGADAEWNRLLAGVAVSLSEGEGTFDQTGVDKGSIESSLTTVSPYARFDLTERVSAWGLAGWGAGDMTIVQDSLPATDERAARPRTVTRTDIAMQIGAVGARGELLRQGDAGGMDLALKADAFFVRMESEKAANSAETTADASRVRLVLEGGRAFAVGGGATFRPSLELGVRHDGGDAETGMGLELGGGVAFTDADSGLSIEARARMLAAHADAGYEEWGASATARLDPGERGRGLSFSLSPTIGASSSAAERLWAAQDARALAPDGGGFEAARGLQGEMGYGLPLGGDRFTGTPNLGFGMSDGGARDYRIGWRLTSAVPGDPGFEVSLDATRNEPANDNGPVEHGAMLRALIRW